MRNLQFIIVTNSKEWNDAISEQCSALSLLVDWEQVSGTTPDSWKKQRR